MDHIVYRRTPCHKKTPPREKHQSYIPYSHEIEVLYGGRAIHTERTRCATTMLTNEHYGGGQQLQSAIEKCKKVRKDITKNEIHSII